VLKLAENIVGMMCTAVTAVVTMHQAAADADDNDGEQVHCRYLLCPASSDVSLLKKFIFLKFDLQQQLHTVSTIAVRPSSSASNFLSGLNG